MENSLKTPANTGVMAGCSNEKARPDWPDETQAFRGSVTNLPRGTGRFFARSVTASLLARARDSVFSAFPSPDMGDE